MNTVSETLQTKPARNTAIDVAKGIGILLVVVGHLWDKLPFFDVIHCILYAFHMPLFFIISGMLFKNTYTKFSVFLKKRLKTLICPYILFAVISWMWYVFTYAVLPRRFTSAALTKCAGWFGQIFYAQYSTKVMNTPLWFVTSLFALEIIYYFISKIKNKSKGLFWIVILAFTALGWFAESSYCPIDTSVLPWNLASAFYALGFYALGNNIAPFLKGYLYSENKIFKSKAQKNTILWALVCVCLFISSYLGIKNGYISIGLRELGNGWTFYVTGIIGTFGILSLGFLLKKCKFLQFCGRNSFYIMATHILFKEIIVRVYAILAKIFKSAFKIQFFAKHPEIDRASFAQCLILTLTVIVLCCIFIIFYNKLKSFILTKKEKAGAN
ncbi:MAG: acyltransferase family protein [Ruminococcus sp.]|nr:acyltransferase family protein [Candidatus Copronaster equi]